MSTLCWSQDGSTVCWCQDGKQYGDEYLAELDYIEVVEGGKEGYESDVVDEDGGGSATSAPPSDSLLPGGRLDQRSDR